MTVDGSQELYKQNQELASNARKLQMVQARLTEADKLIKKMEQSWLSGGSVKIEHVAPPLTDGMYCCTDCALTRADCALALSHCGLPFHSMCSQCAECALTSVL